MPVAIPAGNTCVVVFMECSAAIALKALRPLADAAHVAHAVSLSYSEQRKALLVSNALVAVALPTTAAMAVLELSRAARPVSLSRR